MGVVSNAELLPREAKKAINDWLEEKAYGDYDGLVKKLAEQGYEISRSSLHRYGQKVKAASEKMRRAGIIAADIYNSNGGDFSKLAVTAQALMQEKAFAFMLEHDFDTEDMEPKAKNALLLQLMRFSPGVAKAQVQAEELAINRDAAIAEAQHKQATAEKALKEILAAAEVLLESLPKTSSSKDAVERFKRLVLNQDVQSE